MITCRCQGSHLGMCSWKDIRRKLISQLLKGLDAQATYCMVFVYCVCHISIHRPTNSNNNITFILVYLSLKPLRYSFIFKCIVFYQDFFFISRVSTQNFSRICLFCVLSIFPAKQRLYLPQFFHSIICRNDLKNTKTFHCFRKLGHAWIPPP